MSASSPCVSICEMESGRCIGCGRSETEIAEWRDYPEEKRLAIMDRLEREAAAGGWFADDAFDGPAGTAAAPTGAGIASPAVGTAAASTGAGTASPAPASPAPTGASRA